jgi:hypothetical protein
MLLDEMLDLYRYQWRLSRWNSWSTRAGASTAFHVGVGVRVPAAGVGVGVEPGAFVRLPPEQPETASVASTSKITNLLPYPLFKMLPPFNASISGEQMVAMVMLV